MQNRFLALLIAAAMLLFAAPGISHHSNSAYQVDQVRTLTGVVKEWKWSNPHTWLYLMVDDEKGGKVEWAVEGRAPGVLGRVGWDRSVLKPRGQSNRAYESRERREPRGHHRAGHERGRNHSRQWWTESIGDPATRPHERT